MEYTIDLFVERLRDMMYALFPYENDSVNKKKHKNRQGHIADIAFKNLPVLAENVDIRSFNIGSDYAEQNYPYYHILQQAPTIRKRGKGTDKSKGNQRYVQDLSKRDYEQVYWNGKTFVKEYQKNVRGARSQTLNKATHYEVKNGRIVKVNKNANSYVNIHYQYIDKMLDDIAPRIAYEFDMKLGRKKNAGLAEEFAYQQGTDLETIMDIFGSFMDN